MITRPYKARVYSHDHGNFRALQDANVLIYWPHGFGDWVQFSNILPMLEPSNRYWITRFGDDNTSLMEGNAFVKPLYVGMNSTHCADGGDFDNRHFGLGYDRIDGSCQDLELPFSLYRACHRHAVDAVLWTGFPETWGYVKPPFHTKARNLIPHLVAEENQKDLNLNEPLKSSIDLAVPSCILRWVESRLQNLAGFGDYKMCLIGRNGYTSIDKNWGHLFREDLPPDQRREGEECRQFMRLLLRKDPKWMFLVLEDRLFEGEHTARARESNAFSYAELFGTPDTSGSPFGLVMKALTKLAHLCVGVPAGPYHLSMIREDLPTIGLWIEHLPSWYDEPKEASLHLVSRNVHDRGLDRRPGSFTQYGDLNFETIKLDTRIIPAEQVLHAVERLMY